MWRNSPRLGVRAIRKVMAAGAVLVMMAGCGEEIVGPPIDPPIPPDPDPDPASASARIVLQVGGRELVFDGPNVGDASYSEGIFTIGGSRAIGTSGYWGSFSLSVAADRPGTYEAPPGSTLNWLFWFDTTAGSEFLGSTTYGGSGGRIFVDSLSDDAITGRFEGTLLCNCEQGTAVELSGTFSADLPPYANAEAAREER